MPPQTEQIVGTTFGFKKSPKTLFFFLKIALLAIILRRFVRGR
jgi:hypothetical protein